MDVLELHLPPPQIVVVMQRRQVAADRGDQVVVDRLRHVVGKQRRVQRALVVAGLGVVDVALDRAGQRGGQRVLVARRTARSTAGRPLAARSRLGECSSAENEAWLSSIVSPFSFSIVPNLRSASFSWRKICPAAAGHFALHGQQLFFASAERVRLVAQQPLEQQLIRRQLLGGQKLLHLPRNGHDLGPDVAGRLRGAAGGVVKPALHPLVVAVGRVLGRLQKGIGAQPFAGAVEVDVELQAGGQRLGARRQLASKLGIAADLLLPLREGRFPGRIVGKQARKIPRSAGLT